MLYYTPPPDGIFNELKVAAIMLWGTYDNEFGYVDKKVGRIEEMENVKDDFMAIVAMFDIVNQAKLAQLLSDETRLAVRERLISGGQPPEFIVF